MPSSAAGFPRVPTIQIIAAPASESSAAASDTRRAAIDRWRLGQRSSKQRDTTVPASVTVFRGSEGWNVVLQQSGDGLAAGRHGQHRRAAAGGHKSDRRKLS